MIGEDLLFNFFHVGLNRFPDIQILLRGNIGNGPEDR